MVWTYFKSSFVAAALGLFLAGLLGYFSWGGWQGILEAVFLVTVLAVLEVSLSFDNAIVNAKFLGSLSPVWRQRFLTWGMVIAVFGMRLLFPLLIVAVVAEISPWAALRMALFQPSDYAAVMLSSHLSIVAFGGSFLLMVALDFFYDAKKTLHWIHWLEKPVARLGRYGFLKWLLGTGVLLALAALLSPEERNSYGFAAATGLVTYGAASLLEFALEDFPGGKAAKTGLGIFIYLEVLDATFSFDGVVGAFAVTDNLLIIMLGLSIGAFFVRAFTLLIVDKGVLTRFSYLEHGAFYAIGTLAMILLIEPFLSFPEWLTGLLGAVILLLALLWSHYSARNELSVKPPLK